METDKITNIVIGSVIRVHRTLGPGLLESAYKACLVHDLFFEKVSTSKLKNHCPLCMKVSDWMWLSDGYGGRAAGCN
jgi:GxxExxY protein